MIELIRWLGLTFLLPSGVLLHQAAINRSSQLPAGLEASGTLSLMGETAQQAAVVLGLAPADPLQISAQLSLSAGRCTLEFNTPQRLVVVDELGTVSGEVARRAPWAAWLVRLGCLPFIFRGENSQVAFETLLRKAGGRFDDSALTLENGEVAYVLGAGASGVGPTALVLQKRGLLPLRIWEEESHVRVEVIFRGYRSGFHNGNFPASLELRGGGRPVGLLELGK